MAKTKKEYTNVPKTTEAVVSELDTTETFMIVNIEDKWRIGMNGRWMTKRTFNSKEEAQNYINEKPWDLIMNLAGTIAEYVVWNSNILKQTDNKQ